MTVTTKLHLPYPELSDPADVPQWVRALAQLLDSITVTYGQGLAASRPTVPLQGLVYWSTDTSIFSWADGTTWHDIGAIPLGYITRAMLAAELKVATGTATANDEAVRALGLTGDTAAAGNDTRFPTLDQKAALVGTFGTPNATNRYVTNSDPRWPEVVVSFPSSPSAGEEVLLQVDVANHIYWQFVYLGGVWIFLGGPPLYAMVTNREHTNSLTYAELTTTGPSVTIPLPGTYLVEHGFQGEAYGANCVLTMGYQIGATAAADADGCDNAGNSPSSNNTHTIRQKVFASPGTVLLSKYKTQYNNIPNTFFSNRWIRVTPKFLTP